MTEPSVQLYSIRDAIDADLEGAITRIAEIGFTKVEPYGFVHRADRLRRAFAAAGVTAPSGHTSVIESADPERAFAAAAEIGIGTVIDPFIATDRWQTADDAYRLAERVNELSAQATQLGLSFGYHNHQWELVNTVNGRPVYELPRRLGPGGGARNLTRSGRPWLVSTRLPFSPHSTVESRCSTSKTG